MPNDSPAVFPASSAKTRQIIATTLADIERLARGTGDMVLTSLIQVARLEAERGAAQADMRIARNRPATDSA